MVFCQVLVEVGMLRVVDDLTAVSDMFVWLRALWVRGSVGN